MEREIWFWRNGISERRKRVWQDFKFLEDKFIFWLYKRLKSWYVFFGTHVTFSLDLETPCGCWLGVPETTYIFQSLEQKAMVRKMRISLRVMVHGSTPVGKRGGNWAMFHGSLKGKNMRGTPSPSVRWIFYMSQKHEHFIFKIFLRTELNTHINFFFFFLKFFSTKTSSNMIHFRSKQKETHEEHICTC